MKNKTFVVKPRLAFATLVPLAALAQVPTFDCTKAKGEVEKLI